MPISTGEALGGEGSGRGGCSPNCAHDPAPPDSALLIFDQDTGASSHIVVDDRPVVLRVMRNQMNAVFRLEMIEGCGYGDEFWPLTLGCSLDTFCLSASMFILPVTGRYRLVATDSSTVSPEDLVVTHRETKIAMDWSGVMFRQMTGG